MQLAELALEHESLFLTAMADFAKNDSETFTAVYMRKREWSIFEFRAFLKDCEKERLDWRPGPNKESLTRYLLIDEGEVCGNGLLRFPLNEKTEREGGNLYFDVPPAKRGEGYGAVILNRLLFEAVRAGLARALVTCNPENKAAVRAIELNRGELAGVAASMSGKHQVARYWIRFR